MNHGYALIDATIGTHAPALITTDAAFALPFPAFAPPTMADEELRRRLAGSEKRKVKGKRVGHGGNPRPQLRSQSMNLVKQLSSCGSPIWAMSSSSLRARRPEGWRIRASHPPHPHRQAFRPVPVSFPGGDWEEKVMGSEIALVSH